MPDATSAPLTVSFNWEAREADKRKYIILAISPKDGCPLAQSIDLCKSTNHIHECVTRIGYDSACDYVADARKRGFNVTLMDRVN